MDSTSNNSTLVAVQEILAEWAECQRKGKIILHSDGSGIKKVEFNYYVDL